MNIIVASRDEGLRRSLARLLDSPSNHVQTTSRSSELIQWVQDGNFDVEWVLDGNFDVVIVDDDLAGMGGVETLPLLKQIRPKLPIIMLSSGTSIEVGRRIAEVGVFYHFVKPVDLSDLMHVVRAVGSGRGDVAYDAPVQGGG